LLQSIRLPTQDNDSHPVITVLSDFITVFSFIEIQIKFSGLTTSQIRLTYCLQFLEGFDEIHFFGDKTYAGGNDHEIYEDERVIGHTVANPESNTRNM